MPPLVFIPHGPKRRRTFRTRSKFGCSTCRARHVKCDENKPICLNCVRAQRPCDGISTEVSAPSSSARSQTPSLGPVSRYEYVMPTKGNDVERKVFSEFVNYYAPIFAHGPKNGPDEIFYIGTLLPAAQGYDAVFYSLLACTELRNLPMKEILSSRPRQRLTSLAQFRTGYHNAIDWYCRGVNESIKTVQDSSEKTTSVLIITAVMQLLVEERLCHYDNVRILSQSIFSVVHSARKNLETHCAQDTRLAACLFELLCKTVQHCSLMDSTYIKREHWASTVILLLKISANLQLGPTMDLHVEVWNLVFDFNLCCGLNISDPRHSEFEQRMRTWYDSFKSFATSGRFYQMKSEFDRMHMMWQYMQRSLFGRSASITGELLEDMVSQLLWVWENAASGGLYHEWIETPACMDNVIVPWILTAAWFVRTPAMLGRLTKLLTSLKIQRDYLQVVARYVVTLVNTKHGHPTELELEVCGPDPPKVLQHWQFNRLAAALARPQGLTTVRDQTRSTTSSPKVASDAGDDDTVVSA